MSDKRSPGDTAPPRPLIIGLSASTLEKLRLWGTGPAYYKAGPKIVIYEQPDLDASLHSRRQTSTSQNEKRAETVVA